MKRDAMVLELRVLGGRHAGACVAAEDGLLLGSVDAADVMLSDMTPDGSALRLHLPDPQHWLLWPADGSPDAATLAQAPLLGEARFFGGLPLCVSAPQADWQSVPPQAGSTPDIDTEVLLAPAWDERKAETQSSASRKFDKARFSLLLLSGLAVLVLVVIKLWTTDSTVPRARQINEEAEPLDLTEDAKRQVPALKTAAAHVDANLELRYAPLRDGRVRITGWVGTVQQMDRLSDVMSAQDPRPLMRLSIVEEVREELRAQLGDSYPSLDVASDGPGRLRVTGMVTSEAERDAMLAAVRGQLPADMEVKGALRLASPQLAADIEEAFSIADFPGAVARWTGGTFMVTLTVPQNERLRFEASLVALLKRFQGVPLWIKPKFVRAVAPVRSPPPFPISGVIGGSVPYVVLPDGSKLLPGGRHMGWRLQAIESEVLVFDSPRRLVVAR